MLTACGLLALGFCWGGYQKVPRQTFKGKNKLEAEGRGCQTLPGAWEGHRRKNRVALTTQGWLGGFISSAVFS